MENTKPSESDRPTWPQRIAGTLILLAFASSAGCRHDTPEAALRAQLQQMQAAAIARNPGDFMDGVAKDFAGNGGMDRAALHNLLRALVLGNSKIGVVTGPVEVQIKGETATVRLDAILTGGSGNFLPDNAQTYSITSGWRIEEGEWRVYYAQWQPTLNLE